MPHGNGIGTFFLSFFLACGFLTGNQSMYHAFRTSSTRLLLAKSPVVVPNFPLNEAYTQTLINSQPLNEEYTQILITFQPLNKENA